MTRPASPDNSPTDDGSFDEATLRTFERLRAAALQEPPRAIEAAAAVKRMSAIVLTRNRPALLARALDSLQVDGLPVQALVLDNASEPAAAEAVAALCAARPSVRLERSERNLGCAGGRRLASSLIDAELALFLDDDAEFLPGAIGHLLAELDHDRDAAAVSSTVVLPDGLVSYSGGSWEIAEGVINFRLTGSGTPYSPVALPVSGRADWAPGGATLTRLEMLRRHPIDQSMAAYFEDNEWCYRLTQSHGASFRRSREALVLHHLQPKDTAGDGERSRANMIAMLAACARFYECHGLLLGPFVFDLAGLRAADGSVDVGSARVLMELMLAKGPEWSLAALSGGDLESLLSAHRDAVASRERLRVKGLELAHSRGETEQARMEVRKTRGEIVELCAVIDEREARLRWLHKRNNTLIAIEAGGWWRLRGRLLPLVRLLSWLPRTVSSLRSSSR